MRNVIGIGETRVKQCLHNTRLHRGVGSLAVIVGEGGDARREIVPLLTFPY